MTGFASLRDGDDAEALTDESRETLTYEEALDRVGTGKFQWAMLAICGLGNAADAAELLAVSFILPAVGENGQGTLRLSVGQMALLSSGIFWGALAGTLLWGVVSDVLGRRKAVIVAMAFCGGFGLLSAFCSSFGSLLFLRLLAGVGVGGSVPVVFSYLAEVMPTASRGRFMVLLASFWMVGSIFTACAGWILIPSNLKDGWRGFLVVAALPSLACGIAMALFAPESPRYLVVRNRGDEAMQVLAAAAAMNGRPFPRGALLDVGHGDHTEHAVYAEVVGGGKGWEGQLRQHAAALRSTARQGWRKLRLAFSPGLRGTMLAMLAVWFSISFGWYGAVLWFPTYFTERASAAAASAPPGPPPAPGPPHIDRTAYSDQLLVAISNLPGNILSVYLIDRIGRRKTLAVGLAAGALFGAAFAFAPAGRASLAVLAACGYNGVSVSAWNALDTYSAEVVPTAVRTTAIGLMSAAGRFGAIAGRARSALPTIPVPQSQIVNGRLIHVSQWGPLIPGITVMLMAAGAVVLYLPEETQGRPLQDLAGDGAHHQVGAFSGRDGAAGAPGRAGEDGEVELSEMEHEGASLLAQRRPAAAGGGS